MVVLDTNVIVSALWTPNGKLSYILSRVIAGSLNICHDYRILAEYRDVLFRPKFKSRTWQVNALLETFDEDGISIVAIPLPKIPFKDESARKFYEVARFCGAPLVTGNVKNYPKDEIVMTVAEYYEQLISD